MNSTNSTNNAPLMPKATAVWLIENTTLTFTQIAEFCHLHPLEVQGIADGEVAKGIIGVDPITTGQLSKEEIERCQADSKARLALTDIANKHNLTQAKAKKAKYTPVARRQDKPDAIAWLITHCPNINNSQITGLIGTTKATIESIRERSHWNIANIKAKDPVLLGLCTQSQLDKVVDACRKREQQQKERADEMLVAKLDEVEQGEI